MLFTALEFFTVKYSEAKMNCSYVLKMNCGDTAPCVG